MEQQSEEEVLQSIKTLLCEVDKAGRKAAQKLQGDLIVAAKALNELLELRKECDRLRERLAQCNQERENLQRIQRELANQGREINELLKSKEELQERVRMLSAATVQAIKVGLPPDWIAIDIACPQCKGRDVVAPKQGSPLQYTCRGCGHRGVVR